VGAAFLMKQKQPLAVTAAGPSVPPANLPSATRISEGYKPPLAAAAGIATSARSHRDKLMEALKEELFALETERLEGRIAPEEYDKQKGALEIVLLRALQSGKPKVSSEPL
jgi:hypothetical protein